VDPVPRQVAWRIVKMWTVRANSGELGRVKTARDAGVRRSKSKQAPDAANRMRGPGSEVGGVVHVKDNRPSISDTARAVPGSSEAGSLREVILLAGKVRATPLSSAVDRALVDLPVTAGGSLMDLWQQQLDCLAEHLGMDELPVRVMVDHASQLPNIRCGDRARIVVQRDPHQFRGTGGVLKDVTAGHHPDDRILVAQAAQLLVTPLSRLFDQLWHTGGDVTVVAQADGFPSGTMLVRRAVTELIANVGFVDLKEQALPRIAGQFKVEVTCLDEPAAFPIRTLADYIHALRIEALRRRNGENARHDPYEESWRTSFTIIEQEARVSPRARVHDSVILAGAEVGPEAVIVNSVIGPGAQVPARRQVLDEVVGRKGVAMTTAGRDGSAGIARPATVNRTL
jgi:hypothetical protein